MKKETKVNCKVENCKHNEEKKCELEELDISCTCDKDECEDKKETICNNFEKEEDDDESEELEYIEDDYQDEYLEDESGDSEDEYQKNELEDLEEI